MRLEPDLALAKRFVQVSEVPGRLLLGGITGSHHYGFPSPDSDLDIKAIHLAPTRSLLGLDVPTEAHERLEWFEGTECDLSSNEAKQALRLLLRGNGNMLERILCPYQIAETPEVEALQQLARGAVSRRFHAHYAGFFRGMCREHERDPEPTAKRLLYAYRVAYTGIHLLETSELEADLSVHAAERGLSEIQELIELKRATKEKVVLSAEENARHQAHLPRLAQQLEDALEPSPLPAEPRNRAACEAFLVESRLAEL